MPYYSLLIKANNVITQIVDSADKRFEVHENYMWVEGPDTYDKLTEYRYDPTTKKVEELINPSGPFETERRMSYPGVGDQFDHLWHDMDRGIIPGKESSAWYQAIKSIKDKIPKTK